MDQTWVFSGPDLAILTLMLLFLLLLRCTYRDGESDFLIILFLMFHWFFVVVVKQQ